MRTSASRGASRFCRSYSRGTITSRSLTASSHPELTVDSVILHMRRLVNYPGLMKITNFSIVYIATKLLEMPQRPLSR